MNGRDDILGRIRTALRDHHVPPAIVREYRGAGEQQIEDLVGLFTERVADYRAAVHQVAAGQVAALVDSLLGDATRVLVDPGLPTEFLAQLRTEIVVDDGALTIAELDEDIDAVVTTCCCGIAMTGTVVLDHGPGQGRRRLLTLLPDHHIVIISRGADRRQRPRRTRGARCHPTQTWISGPSATSDIELSRVEGVHGPRTLEICVIGR